MRHMKILGLLAVAAAALMAFAGPASATLTEGTGDPVEAGDAIHASAEAGIEFDGTVDLKCKSSTLGGTVTTAGGTTVLLSTLTFTECPPDTYIVIKKGHLFIESDRDVISTGTEITAQVHRTVLGFPVTTHCTYVTNNTRVGVLNESDAAGHPMAVMKIEGAQIPVDVATSSQSCGSTVELTGSYTFTQPGFLAVD